MSDLPSRPPAGKKRWKAISRDPKENPFRSRNGPSRYSQTVDVDKIISREQVEQWAREAAAQKGYEFIELEVVA